MPPHTATSGPPRNEVRLGVLTNPLSGGNRKRFGAAQALLAACPEVEHRSARTPGEVAAALEELAAAGTNVLALNAGDGTIQTALTALLADAPFATLPLLAVLRAGTTSMTAGDVGLGGRNIPALERLLRWTRGTGPEGRVLSRPVLRVETGPENRPLYGMFFGTGIIYQGIEFFHRALNPIGIRGEIGPGLTMFRFLWGVVRRDPRFVEPVRVGVAIDGRPAVEGEQLLLLVSALERLFLGLRPFFGAGGGALHFTAVGAGCKHLLRAAPSLATGRACRHGTRENGYWSAAAEEVRLHTSAGFTLDGELHGAPGRGVPIVVRNGGHVNFLQV